MSARVPTERGRIVAPRVAVEVLESRLAARTVLAVVRVLDGEPAVGMALESETGRRWEVRGFALAPQPALHLGRRGVLLVPLGHDRALEPGERLHEVEAARGGADPPYRQHGEAAPGPREDRPVRDRSFLWRGEPEKEQ